MRYRIKHITEYLYGDRVSHCYNLAHIIPRTTHRQRRLKSQISVLPYATHSAKREDYFGNIAYHFEIQQPHERMVITATSEVDTEPQPCEQSVNLPWEQARQWIADSRDSAVLLAKEFLLDSPFVKVHDSLREFAQPSFPAQRPLLACSVDLTQRIFREFTYCGESTTVATPLSEVLLNKRGVCQDFAHLQIACLRAMGFPAKYVSGYLETLPPPGEEKRIGADASHAWLSVYIPHQGWIEFDPTNNCMADEQHIITAWGRDYFDVTPLRGVVFGGGEKPGLNVSVDVQRLP